MTDKLKTEIGVIMASIMIEAAMIGYAFRGGFDSFTALLVVVVYLPTITASILIGYLFDKIEIREKNLKTVKES